ncbi:MAG: UDP-3-O-acyl-N-acetylglucosamine deacetylase [Fimbriimonadaceae bacterium]|nr:UDP-3-O-acyl-N-acetylglucosamine deacetylase [Fimbriimonadaceae bacterium]
MSKLFPRFTVADSISWSGKALHGGGPSRVTVHPGTDGIVFRSGDQRIAAIPENVTDTRRCTQLGPVSTIEHLMSALAGLGFTDAEIEVEGGELPAMDGSAQPFVEGLSQSGKAECGRLEVSGLFKRIFTGEDEIKIAIADGDGDWSYEYDCSPRWPGRQQLELHLDPATYAREVANARTFAFREEVEPIRALGLGLGLDEDSCLILGDAEYDFLARFRDEPVRHKLLDLIGDLALAGVPVSALDVSAHRSGHRMNVIAATRLAASVTVTRS